jgi:hypothetical protein
MSAASPHRPFLPSSSSYRTDVPTSCITLCDLQLSCREFLRSRSFTKFEFQI